MTTMAQLTAPLLPAPPSWYPGHMRRFTRRLPSLLSQTDVVLELRDARLPLTSINPAFEGKRTLLSRISKYGRFVLATFCELSLSLYKGHHLQAVMKG